MDHQAAKTFIVEKLRQELSEALTYHGLHHTLDVLQTVEELCYLENIEPYETILVKTAALFHDAGFMVSAQDHEQYSCKIASHYLPDFGYSPEEIRRINEMIMATRIPQSPQDKLGQLLCDADLDYLGRDDFYRIGDSLYQELKTRAVVQETSAWMDIQIDFLEQHSFFTETNKRRRAPQKADFLKELRQEKAAIKKK
jgi:predicted metal-dependent HD superfamily phosphohydrolase